MVTATVWFVAGVGSYVLLEMGELGELSLADFTPIWFDAEMDAGVLRQVA